MSERARPAEAGLLAAAGLAAANAAWAAFLWQQLWVARAGGDPFCALGGDGCAALWDGAFASAIHAATGMPVAGWGVVWSLGALGCTLWTRQRAAAGRAADPAWSATAWFALAGAAAVVVLLAASALAGELCSNCVITYVLVAGFAGAVFVASATAPPRAWGGGALRAGTAVVVAFVVLLYPAVRTPAPGSQLGTEAMAAAAPSGGDAIEGLAAMISGMTPEQRQQLANARAAYLEARRPAPRRPRSLVGARNAPVRLTTFTDSGCGHCAVFHAALDELLANVPPGSIAVEQRVFPLDAACNGAVRAGGRDFLCLAARVRVCLEEDPRAFELAGWLHTDAEPLATESVYAVAERLAPRSELEACVASEDTEAKLEADIAYAMEGGITGTPFVLVNGVPAPTYLPFLYAMAITEGDADHPVFAQLPPPTEVDPHAGHDH